MQIAAASARSNLGSCQRRAQTVKSMSGFSLSPSIRILTIAPALIAFSPFGVCSQTQVDGEYGLWVTDNAGELGVAWLTSGAEEGFVEVLSGERSLYRVETPLGGAHSATFPRPAGDSVLLRYGVRGAEDPHTTVIYLEEDRPPDSGVELEVDSLFVVGDVHGEYDRLRGLLENAGLIDQFGVWTGGRKQLVFLGDVFDRGADVTRTLWFLYSLERQARASGGGAHLVLGNHETMIFTHDVRYVSDKEQLIARLHGVSYPEMFDIRQSVLGRWMASRPGAMRVDDVLLAHGGIVPEVGLGSVEAINDSLRTFLAEDLFYLWADTTVALVTDSVTADEVVDLYSHVILMDSAAVARRARLIFDERSILWFRGYVETDTLAAELDRVLEDYGAELHVVAHTPVPSIGSRYDGKLIAVDLLDPAAEMLLLVRETDGEYERLRLGLQGPPEAI